MRNPVLGVSKILKKTCSRALYTAWPSFSFFPRSIIVFINSKCDLGCRMCDLSFRSPSFVNARFSATGDMPLDIFERLLSGVAAFKPEILLIGTEPLKHGRIIEAIKMIKRYGLFSQLNTDGQCLEEQADSLLDSELKLLVVSVDGNAAVHDRVRGKSGSFAAMLKGLDKIMQLKRQRKSIYPKISIHGVVSNHNYGGFKDVFELFVEKDIDSMSFDLFSFLSSDEAARHNRLYPDMPVSASSVFESNPMQVDVKVLNAAIEELKGKAKRFPLFFFPALKPDQVENYFLHPQEPISGYNKCLYPWKFAHVLPNGDVLVNFRCFAKKMGNIKQDAFVKIWRSRSFKDFRCFIKKEGLTPACLRCFGLFSSNIA